MYYNEITKYYLYWFQSSVATVDLQVTAFHTSTSSNSKLLFSCFIAKLRYGILFYFSDIIEKKSNLRETPKKHAFHVNRHSYLTTHRFLGALPSFHTTSDRHTYLISWAIKNIPKPSLVPHTQHQWLTLTSYSSPPLSSSSALSPTPLPLVTF